MKNNSAEKPLSGLTLRIVNIAVSIATFLIVLDYSIANVSIPYISGDLAVSVDQGTYVITSFAVGSAIVLAITGWLTRQIGSIRLLVCSLLLFVFFSWLCGIALNFQMLIICRFFQGIVAGPLVPLSQALIVSINPPEKRNMAISFWSFIVITAPVIGPILGGWISYDYTWPWIFYINIPIGLFSAGIIWLFLRKRPPTIEKSPLDWIGLILLSLGVTCLQFILDKGEQYDWWGSPLICTLGVISLVSFTFLIAWELLAHKPILDLKLFLIRSFTLSILILLVLYAIYFGTVVLIPLWLQTNMGYTAIWAGLSVAPIGIIPCIFSNLMGKIVNKYGTILPIFISLIFFALSSFYTAYFDTDVNFFHIVFSRFLLGFGLAFFITPLFALSMQDIPKLKLTSAAGIFHFIRAMIGGVGTSLFTTLWIRRTIYHHNVLGTNTTTFSNETDSFLHQLDLLGIKGKTSLEILNNTLDKQAAMLALNDCFYLMGWLFILLMPLLLLGRKTKHEPLVATEASH